MSLKFQKNTLIKFKTFKKSMCDFILFDINHILKTKGVHEIKFALIEGRKKL